MLNKIVKFFSLPIIVLNMGSGIIAFIWLAILGEWRLIGIGIFLLIASPFILSLLMIPSLPISLFSAYLYENKNPFRYLVGYISQLYTNILIVLTCVFAFVVCSRFHSGDIGFGFLPYLLWSWGMALGPWQFLASKEPNNEFSMLTTLSASIFYFLFLISIFINPILVLIVVAFFVLFQLIALPIYNLYLLNKIQ